MQYQHLSDPIVQTFKFREELRKDMSGDGLPAFILFGSNGEGSKARSLQLHGSLMKAEDVAGAQTTIRLRRQSTC